MGWNSLTSSSWGVLLISRWAFSVGVESVKMLERWLFVYISSRTLGFWTKRVMFLMRLKYKPAYKSKTSRRRSKDTHFYLHSISPFLDLAIRQVAFPLSPSHANTCPNPVLFSLSSHSAPFLSKFFSLNLASSLSLPLPFNSCTHPVYPLVRLYPHSDCLWLSFVTISFFLFNCSKVFISDAINPRPNYYSCLEAPHFTFASTLPLSSSSNQLSLEER